MSRKTPVMQPHTMYTPSIFYTLPRDCGNDLSRNLPVLILSFSNKFGFSCMTIGFCRRDRMIKVISSVQPFMRINANLNR